VRAYRDALGGAPRGPTTCGGRTSFTICAAAWFSSAHAELFTLPYEGFAKTFAKSIEDVAKARGLSQPDFEFARAIAATWFYVGPCRGDSRILPEGAGFAAIQTVSLANPTNPSEAAVLEIIGIMAREGLGQSPPPKDACRFAQEIAQGSTSPWLKLQAADAEANGPPATWPSSDIHVPAYCSNLASTAYARSSNDPAETIAAASFEKCRCLWTEAMTVYVDEHHRKNEASSNEAALTVDGMLNGYKKDTIRVLSVVVFDTRAGSRWKSISDEHAVDNLREVDELIDGCKARSVKRTPP
jgi:hypothetical protein